MLTVPVVCCSTRISVVIRNPDRKKNTVTPNPPGIAGRYAPMPACARNTIMKLTARRPSSDGMWSAARAARAADDVIGETGVAAGAFSAISGRAATVTSTLLDGSRSRVVLGANRATLRRRKQCGVHLRRVGGHPIG